MVTYQSLINHRTQRRLNAITLHPSLESPPPKPLLLDLAVSLPLEPPMMTSSLLSGARVRPSTSALMPSSKLCSLSKRLAVKRFEDSVVFVNLGCSHFACLEHRSGRTNPDS
jgi:hypothetical protein